MSKSLPLSFVFGSLLLAAVWMIVGTENASSQDKTKKPDAKLDLEQTNFMRKKLEASGQILEGLTSENSEMIVKGAKILVEMSTAESGRSSNDVMYRQFSGEFQRSAQSLLEAAEKKNYDAAALKWIDTTMKCLECHKFVRGARLVDSTAEPLCRRSR